MKQSIDTPMAVAAVEKAATITLSDHRRSKTPYKKRTSAIWRMRGSEARSTGMPHLSKLSNRSCRSSSASFDDDKGVSRRCSRSHCLQRIPSKTVERLSMRLRNQTVLIRTEEAEGRGTGDPGSGGITCGFTCIAICRSSSAVGSVWSHW